MENPKKEKTPMQKWLDEYTKLKTRRNNKSNFQKFLEWSGKTPQQLVDEFTQKDARHLILEFQKDMIAKGFSDNSVRSYVNTVRAFYASQCETIRNLKRRIVSAKMAKDQHVFSLEDLKAMFHVSNTQEKALLACGVSLGWEASAIRDMDRSYFEQLVKRARSQNEEFISFDWQRKKTGARQYGILSPLALDSLERYLEKTKDEAKAKLWNGITQNTLNNILKRLVEESNIVTTGSVSWHLLRKFLMSQLSDAGLNSFEVKIIVGKAIPVTDLTYLHQIKKQAFEKYRKAYGSHLSLTMNINGKAIYNELADLTVKHIKAQKALVGYLEQKGMLRQLPTAVQDQLNEVYEFARIVEKKNGKPKEESENHE